MPRPAAASRRAIRSTRETQRARSAGADPLTGPRTVARGGWGTVQGLSQLVIAGHIPLEAVGPALRALFSAFAAQA